MKVPVVFIGYRRADTAKRVLERIGESDYPKLYMFLDGPKNPEEEPACEKVRDIVWKMAERARNTEVVISDRNMGSKRRVTTALNAVFARENAAIILEDDCLPSISFFNFMEEMLDRYRDEESVYMVSGRNHYGVTGNIDGYGFTKEPLVWGWGTWRRSWQKYHVDLKGKFDRAGKERVSRFLENKAYARAIFSGCEKAIDGRLDAWDYQMGYVMAWHRTYCVYPHVNLVNNIGFGIGATHTKDAYSWLAGITEREMKPPYIGSTVIEADDFYYRCIEEYVEKGKISYYRRIRGIAKKYYWRIKRAK